MTSAAPTPSACSPTPNAPWTSSANPPTKPPTRPATRPATGRRPGEQRWNAATGTVYLHLAAADLAAGTGAARAEKLGVATLDLLRDWLTRMDHVTIRPVLDTTRDDALDAHDPPGWIRETVILRDGHCVFPGCTIDARACDLDHITAYISPDDGGPPGQTSIENLAALCRRHHRLKTHTGWHYQHLPDGDYQWTSPYGTTYESSPTPKH